MSLESDINSAPPGPVRWGWLEKIFSRIAREAGVISPNQSVRIKVSINGVSLSVDTPPDESLAEAPGSLAIENDGVRWTIYGCNVTILGVNYVVPDFVVTSSGIVAIHIPLALINPDGTDLTCRFHENLQASECELTAAPAMEVVTQNTIENAETVRPGHRTTGDIYIPIAEVDDTAIDHYWRTPATIALPSGFAVNLRHDSYSISLIF